VKGCALLDLTRISDEEWSGMTRASSLRRSFEERGFDMRASPILITPAAHCLLGGIKIDSDAKSSIGGLFAAGEVTGGIHGSNRLGGNALTDALIFGRIAGENAADLSGSSGECEVGYERTAREFLDTSTGHVAHRLFLESMDSCRRRIRERVSNSVGPIREEDTLISARVALKEALRLLEASRPRSIEDIPLWFETRNMALVGLMVVGSALRRTESRGCHYRIDYPFRNDVEWCNSIKIQRREEQMEFYL